MLLLLKFGFNENETGVYTNFGTSAFGCDSNMTLILNVYSAEAEILVGETDVCEEGYVDLTAITNTANFHWNTGSSETVLHVTRPGNYSITAVDGPCTAQDLVVIDACPDEDIYAPNAITPSNDDGVNDEFRRASTRVAIRQSAAHPVSEFLGSVMIAIVLWFGGTLILGDHAVLDAPSFMTYMAILYSVIQPIKDLTRAAYGIPRGLASMERIDKILNAENPITERPDAKTVNGFEHEISLKDVHFSYEPSREILHGVSFSIQKGKTIAIVGQSGSGKSTLVDLVPRFHDVTAGAITIDGTDIRDLKINSLRSLIGNVNQEAILFNDTIFNNIAFGVEDATMEQVVEAAKIANAHEFITAMPDGYQTNIGDRGGKLSGGQRQRISIARAILKNPQILILDEATSALDTESERLVQEALDRLTSTRTTIAIAHRLSTIKGADEILVLHEGRIVERGTHDELLAKDGYYKKLNDMQAL